MDASDTPGEALPRMRSWGQRRSWVRPRRAATRRLRRRQRRPGKRPRRRSRPRRKPVNRSRRRTKPRRPMPGARWTTRCPRRSRPRTLSGARLHRRSPSIARLARGSSRGTGAVRRGDRHPEEAPALHDGYGSTNEFRKSAGRGGGKRPAGGRGPGQGVESARRSKDRRRFRPRSRHPGVDRRRPRRRRRRPAAPAVLIRILNATSSSSRRPARGDPREPAQGAAVAAVSEPYGMESQGTASENAGGPVETAET